MNIKIDHRILSAIFIVLVLPQIFLLLSSIVFYIHAGLISGYQGISEIGPDKSLFYEIYPEIINLCMLVSFYTFFIWCFFGILFWFLNKNENIKTSIAFGAILQVLVIYFIFSPLFSFAVD